MKIKLSELHEYKEYIISLTKNDFEQAEVALNKIIKMAEHKNDNIALSFLFRLLGNIYFLKGNKRMSISYYIESINTDNMSLLPKYEYAKFLCEKMREYNHSIDICNEIIELAKSNLTLETEDDFGSNYYIALCYELKAFCYFLTDDLQKAASMLIKLLELQDEIVVNYTINICTEMVSNKLHALEAKQYLNKILDRLLRVENSYIYQDLIENIKEILMK